MPGLNHLPRQCAPQYAQSSLCPPNKCSQDTKVLLTASLQSTPAWFHLIVPNILLGIPLHPAFYGLYPSVATSGDSKSYAIISIILAERQSTNSIGMLSKIASYFAPPTLRVILAMPREISTFIRRHLLPRFCPFFHQRTEALIFCRIQSHG
ncbi:hypothetical protein BJ508DRAFT_49240 [Ascobolus immersus RN42]|uniref:Uncharacterized protein n=1 Tax=Ascobolus immersus RN42 TaxID=1160509 RepID=A0A3N4HLX6_ASCIM|nr:hypothetical protein BJ508DRAFT_49240 [Ascobolus immersus RN42]